VNKVVVSITRDRMVLPYRLECDNGRRCKKFGGIRDEGDVLIKNEGRQIVLRIPIHTQLPFKLWSRIKDEKDWGVINICAGWFSPEVGCGSDVDGDRLELHRRWILDGGGQAMVYAWSRTGLCTGLEGMHMFIGGPPNQCPVALMTIR